jgi:hypothetical protein
MNKKDVLLSIPVFLVLIVMISGIISADVVPPTPTFNSSGPNPYPNQAMPTVVPFNGATIRVANSYDTVPPVITLKGSSPISIALGTYYNDSGATAWDNVDGNLTYNIYTTNLVDTSTIGTYHVLYRVMDLSGNMATLNRTVYVVPAGQVQNVSNTNASTTPVSINTTVAANNTNPDTNNAAASSLFNTTTPAPVTGGVADTLTSPGGIIGMIAFAFVLIMAIVIVRARKKYNKKIQEGISSTLDEKNKKI